jgi:hypothetical protein
MGLIVIAAPLGGQDYIDKVQKALDKISPPPPGGAKRVGRVNPVGEVIMDAITSIKDKSLTIRPLAEGPAEKHCVAYTRPRDAEKLDARPKGAGARGADRRDKLYSGASDNPDTDDVDERYNTMPGEGTGLGANTTIYFTPGEVSKCRSGAAAQDDDVLLHEMVHALRMMQGLGNPIPTVSPNIHGMHMEGYKDEEEFLAVVITNVYLSAKDPNLPLRRTYHDVSLLERPLNTDKGFVDDRGHAEVLSHYHAWPMFHALAALKTPPFNPFRESLNRFRAATRAPSRTTK